MLYVYKYCLFPCLTMLIGAALMPGYAEALCVKQYELFESEVSLGVPYQNPYDYKEVDLTAKITAPDGSIIIVPAFYSGQGSIWKVRYTPAKKGRFSYQFILKQRSGITQLKSGCFDVAAGTEDGFLRKGPNNPYYPVFDSGKLFFGIGHNIAWVANNNISEYEKYFALLEENGCNLTRVWINTPHAVHIEWKTLGSYNKRHSEKLDELIKLAEKYHIYIVLVLDTYGSLMDEPGPWNEQSWTLNPYNKLNGGPCEKPGDFFSNEEAKTYYRNRLKYIIARWGYSPNIMAFELWNEFDAPAEWVKEMSSYIRSINPHGQLITTSMGYPWRNNLNESSIWKLNEVDFIERHIYGNAAGDSIENLLSVNRQLSSTYKKPVLVGEFGIDSGKNDASLDPSGIGIELHNSLWAAAMSRSFAGAMNWWWQEYIKGKNLYGHYKALSNFVKDVKWDSEEVSILNTSEVAGGGAGARLKPSDVIIKTEDCWGPAPYGEFYIDRSGAISGGSVNSYLHGKSKSDMRLEPLFHINYPCDGKFILNIDMVSQGANLVINMDDKIVLTKELPAGPGEGPWKRSLYRKDYNIYQCVYDMKLPVDVPRGEHVIKLSNTGLDWIKIKSVTLPNFRSCEFANTRIAGLKVGDEMLLWAQNKGYNFRDVKNGIQPEPIKEASFKIKDTKDGAYTIEWWDTFEGKIFKRENVSAKHNELKVYIPEFVNDIACKIISN
ncbi:MAG: DUF5060 domain-containing protein [Candidatus Omnitrophota bacterium]